MYRCFQPDARANLPSIAITAHSLHLHIGVELGLSRMTKSGQLQALGSCT
jgi:hypothetical protein